MKCAEIIFDWFVSNRCRFQAERQARCAYRRFRGACCEPWRRTQKIITSVQDFESNLGEEESHLWTLNGRCLRAVEIHMNDLNLPLHQTNRRHSHHLTIYTQMACDFGEHTPHTRGAQQNFLSATTQHSSTRLVRVAAHPCSQYKQQHFAPHTQDAHANSRCATAAASWERRRGGRHRRPHCVPFSVCQSVTVQSVCSAHRIFITALISQYSPSLWVFRFTRGVQTVTFLFEIYHVGRFACAILCGSVFILLFFFDSILIYYFRLMEWIRMQLNSFKLCNWNKLMSGARLLLTKIIIIIIEYRRRWKRKQFVAWHSCYYFSFFFCINIFIATYEWRADQYIRTREHWTHMVHSGS